MRIGFIGTGTITAAMVRGLRKSPLRDWPVVLSPRNADMARTLAETLPAVTVAAGNQAVIDAVDVVVLAVRPQVAEDVLRGLSVGPDQQVISLMAGITADRIGAWLGTGRICRAIPLPFVEQRSDVVPVFPPDPTAMQLFGALGTALAVRDQGEFDTYASLSALMGTYFGILEAAGAWAGRQGLDTADARTYLAGLFGNLGRTAESSSQGFQELRAEHSTKGGLNEQAFDQFLEAGGLAALTAALDSVRDRIAAARSDQDQQ